MEQKKKLLLTALICAAAVVIAILLIILIFGTYKNKKSAAAPAATEAQATEAETESDAPLTKEQVKRLLEEATETYVGWIVGWGATLDRDNDTFTEGNQKYCLVTAGKYSSIAEINAAIHTYYTNACCEENPIDSLYKERDGKLYGYELLGQGGDAPPGNATLKILSQTETECRVCVEYSEEHASDLNCTLVKEDGKWKFTEPINVYTGYPFYEPTVPWTD